MPHSPLDFNVPDLQINEPEIQSIIEDAFIKKNIELSVLRLDQIHPVISGNKFFKLFYFLQEAKNSTHKRIITFGGAYSNHLAATAFACRQNNLECIGMVRGEKPKVFSPTLLFCLENGMKLSFLSRESYKHKTEKLFLHDLIKKHGEHILIPEGGFAVKGAKGAGLINRLYNGNDYTHVCLPVGTATTFAGMVNENKTQTEIIGFSVLKNMRDLDKRFEELEVNANSKYSFITDYHFGGYAKKTNELIHFMNDFYYHHTIPLDFVYTGKMMFGICDLIRKNHFPKGSKLLAIHTGGLQGNNSLEKGTLIF
jgi:1-aminocyclopropane-1-carboxylate deaminase